METNITHTLKVPNDRDMQPMTEIIVEEANKTFGYNPYDTAVRYARAAFTVLLFT